MPRSAPMRLAPTQSTRLRGLRGVVSSVCPLSAAHRQYCKRNASALSAISLGFMYCSCSMDGLIDPTPVKSVQQSSNTGVAMSLYIYSDGDIGDGTLHPCPIPTSVDPFA